MKPIIRIHSSVKDSIEGKPHSSWTRRDFMSRGLLTGAATVLLPEMLIRSAMGAGGSNCPPPVRSKGALAQIFSDGGATMGARFLSDAQAKGMNAATATRYGIVAADIVKLGPNLNVSKSSPFGLGVMTPPPGYTAAEWTAVLAKTSGGGHLGPFFQDDGGGENLGHLGAFAGFRQSAMNSDLRLNNSAKLVPWASGVASSRIQGNPSGVTAKSLASSFSLSPAGVVSAQVMANSATAAESLGTLFSSVFGANRTGISTALTKASCGFYGDSALADPAYGTTLFDATKIAAVSSKITVASLSAEEQALLAAFYRSGDGTAAGVIIQYNGRDYHGDSPQTVIGPADYEEGRAVAMFLAACDAAQVKGSLIMNSNGQAIANGTAAGTVGTANLAAQIPVATGDAGGSYNAGLILCYDPSSPPTLRTTGTLNATNGNVSTDLAAASSVPIALSGLYLTAISHLGFDVNQAIAQISAGGTSVSSANMVIS